MSALGNKKVMADNILYYMRINGKTRNDLCRDLGFKYTTLTGWLTAEKYPRIDKIEMMANYFGISKADLVEEKSITGEDDGLSEKKRIVIEKIKDMDDEHLEALSQIVDSILRLQG